MRPDRRRYTCARIADPTPLQGKPTVASSSRIFPLYLPVCVAVAVVVVIVGSFVYPPLAASSTAAMTPEAIAARLAPVAHEEFVAAAPAAHALRSGQTVPLQETAAHGHAHPHEPRNQAALDVNGKEWKLLGINVDAKRI